MNAPAEPLRAVPRTEDIKEKFASTLSSRAATARAVDALLAAPRKAAGLVRWFTRTARVDGIIGRLSGIAVRAWRWARSGIGEAGPTAVIAVTVAVVTSRTGQQLVGRAASGAAAVGTRAAVFVLRLLVTGLNRCGRGGRKLAGRMTRAQARVRLAARQTVDAIRTAAAFFNPESSPAQAAAGMSQAYLWHRLVRRFVPNPWLHLAVEGAGMIVIADRGRTVGRAVRPSSGREARSSHPVSATRLVETPARPEPVISDDVSPELPTPGNRAERRALQREQARNRHYPPPR